MPSKRKRQSTASQHSEREPIGMPEKKQSKRSQKKHKKEEEQIKLKPIPKAQWVPAPTFDGLAQSALIANDKSPARRLKETLIIAERRLNNFLKYAEKFEVDFTLEELIKQTNKIKIADVDRLCNDILGEGKPSRTFSAKYYSKDGEPLFFYFGDRLMSGEPCGETIRDIKTQYELSTPQDFDNGIRDGEESVCDGFAQDVLDRYHEATQKLCSILHPVTDGSDKRHVFESGDKDPRVLTYRADYFDEELKERKGVLHLVHGWIQQGQPSKGLFLSSEWTRSGRGLCAIRCWFDSTKVVSLILRKMFKKLFPDVYDKCQAAFDAGAWLSEDPGPWLGRAIVYKLQVDAHLDQKDMNPTASFPCGSFTGGEMQIPQLPAKFTYKPGHICIFRSAEMYHRVAKWEPTDHTHLEELTPGRIGSVSFFPQESYNILKDKEPGWGKDTGYGEWEKFRGDN